ncbi:MAG: hypothetical protein ACREN5_07635 [Gemmatimonadales bacterium]
MPNGRRFPPSWRGRYPHMREVDMPLWNRFLDLYGQGWEAFEYDVRVGPASGAARGFDPAAQAVFESLTKLRIDAVGFARDGIWLFEVKPFAGIGTVGQLVGYRDLFQRERPSVGAVRLGVVTDRFQPAVGEVFKAQGIEVWLA